MDEGSIAVSISSGMIAVMGTLSNTLSLSYFRRKSNTRKQGSLTKRLFINLNICDLVVCVSFFGCSFQDLMPPYFVHVLIVCTAICMLASYVTGFLTCVLSVTRTVSLVRPLHIVKFRSIAFGMIVYGLILLVMVPAYIVCDFEILKGWRHEFIMVTVSRSVITAMLLMTFLAVITSNVASMVTIYLSQSTKSVCEKTEKKTAKKTRNSDSWDPVCLLLYL